MRATKFLFLPALLLLLLPLDGWARTPIVDPLTEEQVRRFARARLADGYALLLGPTPPTAAVNTAGDCRELYTRRAALMRARVDGRRPFWDEPRHSAAVLVGAIWTPAFYYLPYRVLADHLQREQRTHDHADLQALQRAAAAARCFER